MTVTILVVLGWLLLGLPLARWAALWCAREYDPDRAMEMSPGVTALVVFAWAPVVAAILPFYLAERAITRWALNRKEANRA